MVLVDGAIEVESNEIVGVLGPNGAGKTTLLNCLNGQIAIDSGTIEVDGVEVKKQTAHRARRDGISRSFQSPRLSSDLTIFENTLLGLSRSERRRGRHPRARVMQVLEIFDIVLYAEKGPGECPYGVQKLAEVARAFVGQSKVVLLDEPAAGLDIHMKEVMVRAIRQAMSKWKCGVVIVEHDIALVQELADFVMALDLGKTIAQGTFDEVMSHKSFIEAYIGGGRSRG